jgi:hypothetical protein
MNKFTIAIVCLALISLSCRWTHRRVRGNGKLVTQNHQVNPFRNIEVSGSFDVHISQDSITSVKVETDENLMKYVRIIENNGTLVIKNESGINISSAKPIKIYISSPSYGDLEASGACGLSSKDTISADKMNIKLTGASNANLLVRSPSVHADLSGAGRLTLAGKTRDFYVDGSGAVSVRCSHLLAENVDVELSGAGSAHVFASVNLKADISGASSVKYSGNAVVSSHTSGASSLSKAN